MGCGKSSIARSWHDSWTLDSNDNLDNILQQHKFKSGPLKKQLDIAFSTHKHVNQLNMGDALIKVWKDYKATNGEDADIFNRLLCRDPTVIHLFSSRELYNHHVKLVHKMIENCLKHIINGSVIDMGLALHSLGCLHNQKGVTISQMTAFEKISEATLMKRTIKETRTFVNILVGAVFGRGCGSLARANLRDDPKLTVMSKDDCDSGCPSNKCSSAQQHVNNKMIEALRLIVDMMLTGMQRNEDVMTYIKMIVDHTDNCCSRRKLEKNCDMHMAPMS